MEINNKPKKYWINSTILGIGLASLFSDIGHEMATACLPAFLASLGASSSILGIIEGLADGFSSFSKLFSGLYSDRLEKRKPLAVIGYFMTASAMASFSIATQSWHVLIGRVIGWIGRGARGPVRNVLLAEATTPETYGRAFGLERAMDSAGAIIGPLIAMALIVLIGIRKTFLFTLIPGLIAAFCIWFLVSEKAHTKNHKDGFWASIKLLPQEYKKFLLGVGFAGLGDFSNTLLILWATQKWTPIYGATKAAALAMSFYVGYNIVYTLSCYVSGSLADLLPKRKVLAIGYAIAVIPAAALLWAGSSFIKFAIVFGTSGIYAGIWETVENSSAATLLPARIRGIGFGILASVNGIGDLFSSAIVGTLWTFSPILSMAFVIFCSVFGALIVAWV